MVKKILFFIILILSIITINNLIHSTYTLWQKKELVENAQSQLEEEKQKNQELRRKLAHVSEKEFIEQEARDKLFLAKPGEGIVVIPTGAILATPSATPVPVDTRENWERWRDIFF